MIKNILVPMGGSPHSRNALLVAAKLANTLKASLRAVHIEDLSRMRELIIAGKSLGAVSLDMPGIAIPDEELKMVREEIEKDQAQAQTWYDELQGTIEGSRTYENREGNLNEELIKEIRQCDMAVIAKVLKGDEGTCSDLQKSVFNVIHKANRPIMAVCNDKFPGDTVLLAYDGSRSSHNALAFLGNFTETILKKVVILTIKKNEHDALPVMEEASRYLAPYGVAVEKVCKHDDVTESIIKTAHEKGATWIAIGGYGDNVVKELFLGSTTEKVLRSADMPVLMCNA
ncbi:MAG: universal stress protein [Candidatus Eremiobacteraeota bacterium]|nr:universal stress protein [Candidatus Eremiobacteraeota bacterium]